MIFLSAKYGGFGEILAMDGQLVVRDSSVQMCFELCRMRVCVCVFNGTSKIICGAVCLIFNREKHLLE